MLSQHALGRRCWLGVTRPDTPLGVTRAGGMAVTVTGWVVGGGPGMERGEGNTRKSLSIDWTGPATTHPKWPVGKRLFTRLPSDTDHLIKDLIPPFLPEERLAPPRQQPQP
ncbi:unnamed protein product [Pleuronectes platessa]|uniref:Uncharacterized protein n=1 Tax=Pleuronectes platessa TaxID=8262 RepID=A0A9N7VW54_PLEPL|nr:unnamed protein product [Pleuronectes platessa]